jgi:hypothetical protein
MALIYAVHHFDVLAITGPGYLARGWKGERRYARVNNIKPTIYVVKASGTAA